MTKKCSVCKEIVLMPFVCSYCGLIHCGNHRQPENHKCCGYGFSNGIPIYQAHKNRRVKI